jgi:hypothetical protein
MKTKTPKPKKKPAARTIPPPPPGWEIVGEDDPRRRNLPERPLVCDRDGRCQKWEPTSFLKGEMIHLSAFEYHAYALPTTTQSETPPPSPPMIRLRLPSEKPTRDDCDINGWVFIFWSSGECDMTRWDVPFPKNVAAWLPGRLPEGLLPREPTQEEKWQAEFEQCFPDFELSKQGNGEYLHAHAATAWRGFLAAKKGGAE